MPVEWSRKGPRAGPRNRCFTAITGKLYVKIIEDKKGATGAFFAESIEQSTCWSHIGFDRQNLLVAGMLALMVTVLVWAFFLPFELNFTSISPPSEHDGCLRTLRYCASA